MKTVDSATPGKASVQNDRRVRVSIEQWMLQLWKNFNNRGAWLNKKPSLDLGKPKHKKTSSKKFGSALFRI